MRSRKEQLKAEYNVAKKMGCGAGFWVLHCQEMTKLGVEK